MMQATGARHTHPTGGVGLPPFENTPRGRLFVQGIMNAIFVIVLEVLSSRPPHVRFVQDDHVVQQFSATASSPALRHAVLSGTAIIPSN